MFNILMWVKWQVQVLQSGLWSEKWSVLELENVSHV